MNKERRMVNTNPQQFKAAHVYFNLIAKELNAAGYDFKKFLEVAQYKLDVPFTKELFKDQIWQPIVTGKHARP